MLFVPHSMTTFINRGGKAISLARHKKCSTRSLRMPRLINLLPKKSFSYVIITCETCHDLVSYYNTIKIVMVNVETVIVVNFKPVIIVNSFRLN